MNKYPKDKKTQPPHILITRINELNFGIGVSIQDSMKNSHVLLNN